MAKVFFVTVSHFGIMGGITAEGGYLMADDYKVVGRFDDFQTAKAVYDKLLAPYMNMQMYIIEERDLHYENEIIPEDTLIAFIHEWSPDVPGIYTTILLTSDEFETDTQTVILDTYNTSYAGGGFELKVPVIATEVMDVPTIKNPDDVTDLCQIDPSVRKEHFRFWNELLNDFDE